MPDLSNLLAKTTRLKDRMEMDHISLIEEDLKSIFIELKELISPSDLDLGISVMQNGTLMLEQKIEEVKRFINYLTQKDQIFQFITSTATDHQLATILSQVWHEPIQLPYLSMNYLVGNWAKLVRDKKIHHTKSIQEISPIEKKTVGSFTDFSDPFEEQMLSYLDRIKPILPATMEEILGHFDNPDQYFEQFSFILHLLQEGYLYFNKSTQQFIKGEIQTE
ncbi:hypothetical protein [Candidatus Lokiarchaeum ossiferum]|uniref:hypothetical protein n=1 Tax=Candidatus Lokiarchaeum ossiferum TaxID=2951803 RepID=UPI00352F566B